MAGIMHFAAFFRYMESAEHEMLRSWGFSIFAEVDGKTISFPRVRSACEYHAPARSEDVFDISITVKHIGNSSISYMCEFFCQDKPIATGEITCVCCLMSQDQPPCSVSIPDQIREHLEQMMGS